MNQSSFQKAPHASRHSLERSIRAAQGLEPCDTVFKNVQFLDVFHGRFQLGDVAIADGLIVGVKESYEGAQTIDGTGLFLVPGFIDAHVHIESSLMTPSRFEEAVLPLGTTTVIWDPHEIANVKGVLGIEWALESSQGLDLDVFVMVPSCVPSTSPALGLESSGAQLLSQDLIRFKEHPRVLGLAEMMNFPGLLGLEEDVIAKLFSYGQLHRDGHCPGLSGRALNAYAAAGIHSCHESISRAEAAEKLSKGIHVFIREGSCAKDAAALLPMLDAYNSAVIALASDDRNPRDIKREGHINAIINMALSKGIDPTLILRAASWAPAQIFGLKDRGAIAPGYRADLILCRQQVAKQWQNGLEVLKVFKAGQAVSQAKLREAAAKRQSQSPLEPNLKLATVSPESFVIQVLDSGEYQVRVIGVVPGQIVTKSLTKTLRAEAHELRPDLGQDILPIAVLERHQAKKQKGLGLVHGFGIKSGAVATSINHDSHNVIVVGASPAAMAQAVNELIRIDGGIVVTDGLGRFQSLALPVGGLMTDLSPEEIAAKLEDMHQLMEELGCQLHEPFLQLSFLALPVIPELKITDRGLVHLEQGIVPLLIPQATK